ncbi:MAG: ribonuclease III [Magnetospiraceae bacterium]
MADPHDLQAALAHSFHDSDLLQTALTHASLAAVTGKSLNNERLEFLGDRVLGLVIARLLFDHFPKEDEGRLARRLAALVSRETLAVVAGQINLGAYLRLSQSEEDSGGRENPGMLANCCEAVIAALYLDGGMEAAAGFIERHWTPLLEELVQAPKDSKTALQEWAQARGLGLPEYSEVARSGPDHAPIFTIQVAVSGYPASRAEGPSKRVAEREAATVLLSRLEKETA